MIIRRHIVYRGHRSPTKQLPRILLFLIVLILLALLAAFALLPQYLVYTPDSAEMVVPLLEESGKGFELTDTEKPQPYPGTAEATFTVAAPDYSYIDMADTDGLDYMQGSYVPFSKITETGLESAKNEAQRSGVKGLIMEMKNRDGSLAWASTVAKASSCGANGKWDMSAELAELKADGWYLAAELPCAVDTLMATKMPETALRDFSGAPYADGRGTWVDPWNKTVREYIAELAADLISMGFDEIILTDLEHPSGEVLYTREIAGGLDHTACVMNCAIAVRQLMEKTLSTSGAHLCVEMSHDALTGNAVNGQSFEYFLKVFDRLIIKTTTYHDDAQIFVGAHIDSTLRYVPQMSWSFSGGSWVLDPSITED